MDSENREIIIDDEATTALDLNERIPLADENVKKEDSTGKTGKLIFKFINKTVILNLLGKFKKLMSKKSAKIIAVVLIIAIIGGTVLSIIAHNSISKDIRDCEFKIDGTVYQFPVHIDAFLKKGWSFTDGEGEQMKYSTIASQETEVYYIENKKGNEIALGVYNPANISLEMKDCLVVSALFEYCNNSQSIKTPNVELAKGIKLKANSLLDVQNAHGKYDSYKKVLYTENSSLYWWSDYSESEPEVLGSGFSDKIRKFNINNYNNIINYSIAYTTDEKEDDGSVVIGFDKDDKIQYIAVYRTSSKEEMKILKKFSSYK